MAAIIDDSIINVDPDRIDFEDKDAVKNIIIALLSTSEHLVQENIKLREENQQLRDEIAILKGEKGKPKIRAKCSCKRTTRPKA
jgi:regulator of replication initiation timing